LRVRVLHCGAEVCIWYCVLFCTPWYLWRQSVMFHTSKAPTHIIEVRECISFKVLALIAHHGTNGRKDRHAQNVHVCRTE
jgi:hypothetical protein